MEIVEEPAVEPGSIERGLERWQRFRQQHCVRLRSAFHRAPLPAPLADVLAPLAALHVVDHAAAVHEQPQHFPQRRLVVEASDSLGRRAECHRFLDAKDNRRANSPHRSPEVLVSGLLHLAERERARKKSGQQVDDLSPGGGDHLVHAIGDDSAGAGEDPLSVGPASDEAGDAARLIDRDLLIALQRFLVAPDLRDDRIAQSQSLVAMLLHIFDLDIVSFRNVERANCFEETERDYGIYSAGHLVDRRRAQANRRSNRLQAGDREVAVGWKSSTGSVQLTEVLARAVIGAVLSVFVAVAARRARTLATSGVIVASVMGTISLAAGWSWGALLLTMFVSASILSRFRERQKAKRVGPVVEKGAERDAGQVLANGGVYAVAALGSLLGPSPIWYAIGAGALAASAADTWATEVGTLAEGDPISIISGRRVAPGTSVSYTH